MKRYDLDAHLCYRESGFCRAKMTKHPEGDYVLYDECTTIEAERNKWESYGKAQTSNLEACRKMLDDTEAERDKLRGLLREVGDRIESAIKCWDDEPNKPGCQCGRCQLLTRIDACTDGEGKSGRPITST